jgi:hypothetical protein
MSIRGEAAAQSNAKDLPGSSPARLGKNAGAYHGEPIDIVSVIHDSRKAAQHHGWTVESLLPESQPPVYAFSRRSDHAQRRIYFSTGIHGDEPAGPLAIRQLLQDNAWPADVDLWLMPCLNPEGFILRTRTNRDGVDLNRDYRQPRSHTVCAHVNWLERQPRFDFAVCLHEDWEAHGFYLYELNPDGQPSLAERVIDAVAGCFPIDPSPEIDGWPAKRGIIRPHVDPVDRPEWPEAIYLVEHRTRHSYTLESPSDFELAFRVKALITGARALLLSRDEDRVD